MKILLVSLMMFFYIEDIYAQGLDIKKDTIYMYNITSKSQETKAYNFNLSVFSISNSIYYGGNFPFSCFDCDNPDYNRYNKDLLLSDFQPIISKNVDRLRRKFFSADYLSIQFHETTPYSHLSELFKCFDSNKNDRSDYYVSCLKAIVYYAIVDCKSRSNQNSIKLCNNILDFNHSIVVFNVEKILE